MIVYEGAGRRTKPVGTTIIVTTRRTRRRRCAALRVNSARRSTAVAARTLR